MALKVEGVRTVTAGMERFKELTTEEVKVAINVTTLDVQRAAMKYAEMKTTRRTGALVRGILVAFPSDLTGEVYNTAPHAPYIEYGTKPHRIRIRNKKVLASRNLGGQGMLLGGGSQYTFYGKEVFHPGTRATPYMEPAAKYGEKQLFEHLTEALKKALSRLGGQ